MFDKLGQLKDLWKLKSQMEEIKKRLDNMVCLLYTSDAADDSVYV